MASEDTKILEFNQYQKSCKASFGIYADPEYLIEKTESFSRFKWLWFSGNEVLLNFSQWSIYS